MFDCVLGGVGHKTDREEDDPGGIVTVTLFNG